MFLEYDLAISFDRDRRIWKLNDLLRQSKLPLDSFNYKDKGPDHPSFFLPSKGKSLRLLHGSCRKLDARGKDALAAGDMIVEAHATDLSERPSVLFLTGDQIYADDVPAVLLSHLTKLSQHILVRDAAIPGETLLGLLGVERRKDLAKSSGFNRTLQLLGFGEYAAMYLMAFSEAHWPTKGSSPLEWTQDEKRRTSRTRSWRSPA